MHSLLSDLRYGVRSFARRPLLSATAIIALALGIGANTAIFSIVNGVILRPLPYPDPERLVMLWETNVDQGLDHERLSPVNFLDYRAQDQIFQDAAAWWHPEINLTDAENEPLRVKTIEVSGNFFTVMGISPMLGTGFPETEGLWSRELRAVISHALWQSRFGGRPDVIGEKIQLSGQSYLVTGVMPAGFSFPARTDVWQRLQWDLSRHSRAAHFMEAVGRLKPEASLERANLALGSLSSQLQQEYAGTNKGWGARATALDREVVGVFHEGLLALFAAVSLLLLLACANVANLLLSRASSRQKEIALRAALGASRIRVVRQLLTESLVLGLTGAAAGLVLAVTALIVTRATASVEIPRVEQVHVDGTVLAFTILTAFVTTLFFGLFPAFQLSRTDLQQTLKDGGRGESSGNMGARLRSFLVVAEIALAVVIMVGAGLLVRSFSKILEEDPGFQPARVVAANIELPNSSYSDWNQVPQFFSELLERMKASPGIESAGAASFLPLETAWRIPFAVKGRPPVASGSEPDVQYFTVTPDYFSTLGVPLLQGRTLTDQDRADSPGVVLINQEMARRYWPGEDPVGDVLISFARNIGPLGRTLMTSQEFEIVGVVGDVKNNSLQKAAEPALFMPYRQFPYKNMHVVLRGRGDVEGMANFLREEVRRLDPALPVSDFRTLEQFLSESVARPRLIMMLMSGFAFLALILAVVGIYGVLSYSVSQRRHELGVRLALGASRGRILRLVLSQGLGMTFWGLVAGVAGAFAVTRFLSSLLFGVEPLDTVTYGLVVLLVALIALVAAYAPASRAARVDPLLALRND